MGNKQSHGMSSSSSSSSLPQTSPSQSKDTPSPPSAPASPAVVPGRRPVTRSQTLGKRKQQLFEAADEKKRDVSIADLPPPLKKKIVKNKPKYVPLVLVPVSMANLMEAAAKESNSNDSSAKNSPAGGVIAPLPRTPNPLRSSLEKDQ